MDRSDQTALGTLDITADGFGWLRPATGSGDRVLVTAALIRRYALWAGDRLLVRVNPPRPPRETERWAGAILAINGVVPDPPVLLDDA